MWNKIYIYTFFKHSIQRKEALHQSTLCKINYIFIFESFSYYARSSKISTISMKIKTRKEEKSQKKLSPLKNWSSTCPLCHKKRIPPPFFFLSIYFRKKRTPPRYLHRVCSSWVALPSRRAEMSRDKIAKLNTAAPRVHPRTYINK